MNTKLKLVIGIVFIALTICLVSFKKGQPKTFYYAYNEKIYLNEPAYTLVLKRQQPF